MIKKALILFGLLNTIYIQSQTLKIVEEATLKPVSGLSIRNSSNNIRLTTNENGTADISLLTGVDSIFFENHPNFIPFNYSYEQLKKLNKIVHPTVQKHFKEWLKIHDSAPYVIKEAAILFETNGHKQCDKVITVVAPQLLRIERVVLRDKSDKESVLQRIDNQWSDEKKILLSDFVIENIDLEKTKAQVDNIIKLLNKI